MSFVPPVVTDTWNAFHTQRGETEMFIRFDEAVASLPTKDKNLHCARVLIPIQEPNDAGGPQGAEAETLWAMEDQLTGMLEHQAVPCRLVACLTYGGWRELVFHLPDWTPFRPVVGRWMELNGSYEIDVSEHEGWDFYNDYVRPSTEDRLAIMDRMVIDRLLQQGSDPEKLHSLDYCFMGEAAALTAVAEALTARGYLPSDNDADPSTGRIVYTVMLPLDTDRIVAESLENQRLANELDAEFFGWGAGVVE